MKKLLRISAVVLLVAFAAVSIAVGALSGNWIIGNGGTVVSLCCLALILSPRLQAKARQPSQTEAASPARSIDTDAGQPCF